MAESGNTTLLDVDEGKLKELETMKESLLHTLDAVTRGMNITSHINPCKWYQKKCENELNNFFGNLHRIKVQLQDFTFSSNEVLYEEKRIEGKSEFDRCYDKWHVEIVSTLRDETWDSEALGEFLQDILLYCDELKKLI